MFHKLYDKKGLNTRLNDLPGWICVHPGVKGNEGACSEPGCGGDTPCWKLVLIISLLSNEWKLAKEPPPPPSVLLQ